jgi:hypothetical protein
MNDDLIARLKAATRHVPALLGTATMALMLVAYPRALTGLKDATSACIMLMLGAGHLCALWCCIAALRDQANREGEG